MNKFLEDDLQFNQGKWIKDELNLFNTSEANYISKQLDKISIDSLSAYTKTKILPRKGMDVELSVDYIREACDCQDKYKTFANLNNRVIKGAVEEINRVTLYQIDMSYKKKGRSVSSIIFHLNMQYH